VQIFALLLLLLELLLELLLDELELLLDELCPETELELAPTPELLELGVALLLLGSLFSVTFTVMPFAAHSVSDWPVQLMASAHSWNG
jgi:hypothetical protein